MHGGDRLDQLAKELGGGSGVGPLKEPGKGKLGGAVNGDKEIELTFGAPDFGNVDMKEADRVGFELLLFD